MASLVLGDKEYHQLKGIQLKELPHDQKRQLSLVSEDKEVELTSPSNAWSSAVKRGELNKSYQQ